MNRWIIGLGLVAGIAVVGAGTYWWMTRPLPHLTVTTWPGVYGRAQAVAMLHPFGEEKRVAVRIAQYDGGLDHLREEVAAKDYDWDVIDFELADAVAACRAGLLEPIDLESLPRGADQAPARRDFVPGALGPCWVGSVVFSQVMVYAPQRFPVRRPQTLLDFFDAKTFPGPRALRRSGPKFNLEMALLADGVPPPRVYALLSTRAGVNRAFAKLETLRGSLVWWTHPSEPIEMLADGRVAIATALNGDVYDAQLARQNIGVNWDHQLYELDVFGIPRGDRRRDRALDFIRFATGSEALARTAEWVPYGPARRSSLQLVGKNPELGVAMEPYLPTARQNFSNAFAIDDGWWLTHGAALATRWQAFVHETNDGTSKPSH